MYEAVGGTPPHVANTPLELAMKMATEDVTPVRELNEKVSAELGALVDDLLKRDVGERPNDAEKVAHRIESLPEFAGRAASEGSTTVVGIPLPRGRNRRKQHAAKSPAWKRVAGFAVVAALVAGAGLWWQYANEKIWLNEFSPNPGDFVESSIARPMQDLSTLRPEDDLEVLLGTRNGTEHQRAFTARAPGLDQDMQWLVTLDEDSTPTSILAFNDGMLSKMELSLQDKGFSITGDWASYRDPNGTVFLYGSVAGQLEWQSPERLLLGQMSWTNSLNGSSVESMVSAWPSPLQETRTAFGFQIEDSEVLTPLLHLEVLPRHHQWAHDFDALFPIYHDGRANVRFQANDGDTGLSWSYDALRRLISDGDGKPDDCIVGIPTSQTPIIRFKADEEALHLTLETTIASDDFPERVEFALAKDLLVPISHSPIYNVVHYLGDGTTIETYDGEIATACTATSTRTDNTVQVKLTVPYAAFLLNPSPPRHEDTMRFNAALVGKSDNAEGKVVAYWGFPGSDIAKHGALVRFLE